MLSLRQYIVVYCICSNGSIKQHEAVRLVYGNKKSWSRNRGYYYNHIILEPFITYGENKTFKKGDYRLHRLQRLHRDVMVIIYGEDRIKTIEQEAELYMRNTPNRLLEMLK